MTVRVLEPNFSGHHLYYVRVLAAGSSEPIEWVTTAAAAKSTEAQVHLAELVAERRLTVRVLDPWPSRLRVLWQSASCTSLPDGDRWLGVLLLAGLRRGRSYRVLLMRPDQRSAKQSGFGSRFRRSAKRLLLRALRVYPNVLVFGLVDAFGYGQGDLQAGVPAVADPVLPRKVPVVEAHDGVVVGLLGAVDVRKNPALVAAACGRVPTARLNVVGGVTEEAHSGLHSAGLGLRMTVDDRYVDEAELVRAAAECDVLALLYDNHDSSSGLLALAAQVGVPVLVPAGSRLAAIAEHAGLAVATALSVDAVAAALCRVGAEGVALRSSARQAALLVGTDDFVAKLLGPTT